MTVAVAVNRYLDISSHPIPRINNGYMQALIVLIAAACVNIPRWLEFSCCDEVVVAKNVTDQDTGEMVLVNITQSFPIVNPIRNDFNYIRDYTLISSNVLTVLIPMILMSISSILIYQEMAKTAKLMAGGAFSDAQEAARRRRNRSVTLMLIGIIILFIVCHVGELALSVYELIKILQDGEKKGFPPYIKAFVTINTFLLCCNSALNFVIYCKDVFFR